MKFESQWKGHKNSYGARQILALFWKQVALILGSNCVKGLIVSKVVKETKFEESTFFTTNLLSVKSDRISVALNILVLLGLKVLII